MMGFKSVSHVTIPYMELEKVYMHLRESGARGVEGVALFTGVRNGDSFEVKSAIIPTQKAFNHDGGLLYTVEEEELYRINVWLYRNKQQLIAQIHSHPSMAYHSETDDKYPIVTTIGGFSIVVPNFGFGLISPEEWAVYRLNSSNKWIELKNHELNSTIQII